MPGYAWSCLVCAALNQAGTDRCASCRAPGELSPKDILARQRKLGLDDSVERQPGVVSSQLRQAALWMPAGYAVLVTISILPLLHPAWCGGDMCGLFFAVLLLPWTMKLSYLLLLPGFIINLVLISLVGYGLDRLVRAIKKRAQKAEQERLQAY